MAPGEVDEPDDGEDEKEREYGFFGPGVDGMDLHRRTFTMRFDTGDQARLRVENRNGAISLRTHDQPAIVVDVLAEIYAASSSEADAEVERLRRSMTHEGDRVDIRTPDLPRPEFFFFGRGPKVDYEIRAPAATELQASNRNGAVLVTGTRRPVQVEVRNGRVSIEEVASEVSVETRNGRVNVEHCAGPVQVSGTNGHIKVVKAAGNVAITTTNGVVEITGAGAGVKVATTNGHIRLQGRINGDVDLQATNGAVRVSVPADSRFEIDAESRRGSVRSDLKVRERPQTGPSGPLPKVRLRTTNGSIVVSEA